MRKVVLGLGIYGHDAAACLVDAATGRVLFASAEERFSNQKHSYMLPTGGIGRCLDMVSHERLQLSQIAVNINEVEILTGTLQTLVRHISRDPEKTEAFIRYLSAIYPYGDYYYEEPIDSFSKQRITSFLKYWSIDDARKREITKRLLWYYNLAVYYHRTVSLVRNLFPDVPVLRVNHHLAHAAAAYFNAGFRDAAVITMDGQGESETATIYKASRGRLERIASSFWPCSVGIFYWNATTHLGFKVFDEYKVMGMAAYGKPVFRELIEGLFAVGTDGVITLHENEYFKVQEVPECKGHIYTNFTPALEKVVPRSTDQRNLKQVHFDFAASVQAVTEEIGVAFARAAIELTGIRNLVLAGGVGLNGLMNEQIRRKSGCGNQLFVFPASGDDGGPVGAAQYAAHCEKAIKPRAIGHVFWGTDCRDEEIVSTLDELGLEYDVEKNIHAVIARALHQGMIVARCHGRAEFGPRALGHRSILASPCSIEMKEILNERIKHREPFRPFAPACLEEHAAEYFDLDASSPFMLLIPKARDLAREKAPAIYHADGTARVQTVSRKDNPDFHRTIREFHRLSGVPMVINTSFNVNGEAIVDSPLDAIESFGHMDIDYLALGNCWVSKQKNSRRFPRHEDREYLKIRTNRFFAGNKHPLKHYCIYEYFFARPNQS